MARFVVDASATLPWCFEDEANVWSDGLLERLRNGDEIVVPAHWPTEISNGMLMALRRRRILPGRPQLFWDQLVSLPIRIEPPLSSDQAKAVLDLCEQHGLTFYDATYLELARRIAVPLATLDQDLITAAHREGVALLTA